MKLKIYNLLKPLGTTTQQNYLSFYPSELIYFALFTMRHPVPARKESNVPKLKCKAKELQPKWSIIWPQFRFFQS